MRRHTIAAVSLVTVATAASCASDDVSVAPPSFFGGAPAPAGGGFGGFVVGSGGNTGVPNGCDATPFSAFRNFPDGRALITTREGFDVLLDPSCPGTTGPDGRGDRINGPTTLRGCCLPSGKCGLFNYATDASAVSGQLGPRLLCFPYGKLASTAWRRCGFESSDPECAYRSFLGCFTVPPDPDMACDPTIGEDAGAPSDATPPSDAGSTIDAQPDARPADARPADARPLDASTRG